MYSYGYTTLYSGTYVYETALSILLFVALIAALVLSVVFYVKFVKSDQDQKVSLTQPRELKSFLRFDTLIIDKVLRYMYLLCSLLVAFVDVAIVLASLAQGFISFVCTLVIGAVIGTVMELMVRLAFEFTMQLVVIGHNTTDIKNELHAKTSVALPPAQGVPAASTPATASEVANSTAASAPSEGPSEASIKKVCSNCSFENAADATYCSHCGTKLS